MTDTTAAPRISDAACRELLASMDRTERLKAMSNEDLSHAVMSLYIDAPACGPMSDVLSCVIDRLRVLDVPVDEINRRIEEQIDSVEFTEEDYERMDLAFHRAVARMNGEEEADASSPA